MSGRSLPALSSAIATNAALNAAQFKLAPGSLHEMDMITLDALLTIAAEFIERFDCHLMAPAAAHAYNLLELLLFNVKFHYWPP